MESHWATYWEALADAVPEADALIHGERRVTWSDYDARAGALAGAFEAAGLQPGSKVGHYLYNAPEYAETYFAALKVRAVPVNVNYRYLDDELTYLLDNAEAEALVFHTSLGDRVARVAPKLPRLRLLIAVDDGPPPDGTTDVEGAAPYEEVVSTTAVAPRRPRDPGDITMTYTGGTTGMPKGVMSRIGGGPEGLLVTVPPLVGSPPLSKLEEGVELAVRLHAEGRQIVSMPACPLMHGTGLAIGMVPAMSFGGAIVLLPSRGLDADELWRTVERERVQWIAIVGDAFARPMLRALQDAAERGQPYDTSSMRIIGSAGAMFSAEVRRGLLEHMPQLTIIDYIAATEGGMGAAISTAANVVPTGRFTPSPNVKVLDERGHEVKPGSGEQGMVAVSGSVPEGYYKDEAKTASTFRVIGGVRYSIPGDWATVEEDGSITLLGRGSQCINTGGEKVFPEEVEEAIKRHPAVDDCLVFGVPDERFGQRVVGVASRSPGAPDVVPDEVIGATRESLAAYKVPRALLFVDTVPRAANGKADYPGARELFLSALD